jgi:hypothetical protein
MPSPGFQKKELADFKIDLMALCGFGCSYCSSNWGNYLRINREDFAERTEKQLGKRLYPDTSPDLAMIWPDVLEKLSAQVLAHRRRHDALPIWGLGKTLVFSMLTDGFSPVLVGNGTTEKALRLVLDNTRFRIRVLTKNAVVGAQRWIDFFLKYPGRFVVGLSCGTLDGAWARKIEKGTSSPRARIEALRALQDAGVPTYGMLCPIFPDLLDGDRLHELVREIRPSLCETIWAEPFNDRANWECVRAGYPEGSDGWSWLTEAYANGRNDFVWSAYATELYRRLRAALELRGERHKLRYLLYENPITALDSRAFAGLYGVLLQTKPREDGYSPNPFIQALQTRPNHGRATVHA